MSLIVLFIRADNFWGEKKGTGSSLKWGTFLVPSGEISVSVDFVWRKDIQRLSIAYQLERRLLTNGYISFQELCNLLFPYQAHFEHLFILLHGCVAFHQMMIF